MTRPAGGGPIRLPVREEPDVALARARARELARGEGFRSGAAGALATAVTEIARNLVVHAGGGDVLLEVVEDRGRRGVLVVARDAGPGIPDMEAAMRDGYSTSGGLGMGLPGARRLMDEFAIRSAPGEGTTVTMKKWAHAG